MQALIVGAGIGGLTAGAALAQRGITTDVVEVRSMPSTLGVGIHLRANALRALNKIGILDEVRSAGFAYDRTIFRDHRDNFITEVGAQPGGEGMPATVSVLRPPLHEILRSAADLAGARVIHGITATELVDREHGVHVTFSDGRQRDYDLVVGFDGIRSPLRRHLFGPEHEPVSIGTAIWRVPLSRTEEVTTLTVFFGPTTVAGCAPLSDDSMYLFLITPELGAHEGEDSLALLRERLVPFTGHIAELRDGLSADDEVHFHRLSELLLPLPWSSGRVIVLGDAAHASNPQAAQGAAMAMEDAIVLAEEFACREARPIPAALNALARRRYPRVKFVHDEGRALRSNAHITEEALPIVTARMATSVPAQRERADAFMAQPY